MTTAETVSASEAESTRMAAARIEGEILRAVGRVTQARAAACMEISASTISRTLEDLPRWALLLAAVGLQVAPLDAMVVDQGDLVALKRMSLRYLQADLQTLAGG